MWDPLLSDAEYSGELRVVASGEGRVNNHQFYLSRRDYASRNSDIMQRLLAELAQTGDTNNIVPLVCLAAAAALTTALALAHRRRGIEENNKGKEKYSEEADEEDASLDK